MKLKQPKKIIHYIGGEKGGLGKSFFARIMAQYWLDLKRDMALFDADRTNKTFYRYYNSERLKVETFFFSEADEYLENGNILIETAFNKDVLIDLPGQSVHALNNWLKLNYIFDVAAELDLEMVYWFVSDGSPDSLDDFKIVTDLLKGKMQYVFVKNEGKCNKWDLILESIESIFNSYKIETISLPAFKGDKLKATIDDRALSWSEAREYKEFANSMFDRHRVKAYLNLAYQEINKATVIQARSLGDENNNNGNGQNTYVVKRPNLPRSNVENG